MIRRSFLLSLAAMTSALTATRTQAAPGFGDRGPWDSLPDRGRVFFWHAGRILRPRALILAGRTGGLRLSLANALPQFDENRLDLDAAPVVRPTIGRRLLGATQVGLVWLDGDTLIAGTTGADSMKGGDAGHPSHGPAVIAYRRQSWDVPRAVTAKAAPTGIGLRAMGVQGLPVVGAAYATATGSMTGSMTGTASGLVLALAPTIVDMTGG